MWLDYISTNNSSLCFQPFCLVANADSIKKEKLFLLHQSDRFLSVQHLSTSQILFLAPNSSLGARVFPKTFLKLVAEDTLVFLRRKTKKWEGSILFYVGYPQHQCSAEQKPPCLLPIWHWKLLIPIRLELYSKWPDFPPWHVVGADLMSPTPLRHISQSTRWFYQLL